jgi:orotidine-5'-phosphate decarboxylase
MNSLSPRERLIVALDFPTDAQAMRMVEQLSGDITLFKIGLQLYTAAGPKIVTTLIETGANVFLDLKLHDIPNTVAGAVAAASELGVQMLTLHLSGGLNMIEAAVASKQSDLLILGVTVLTSADEQTLQEVGIHSSVAEHARRLAELGIGAGIDGVVASPHEIKTLRALGGKKMRIVTPGIRPPWSEPGDQRRSMTPREALQLGADYLVIGRPITRHKNPREAVTRILDEISA